MTRAEKDSYNTTRRKWYKTAHGFEMAIAHAHVGAALKNGKLFKNPCEVCCTTEVEAHHDDYSKQLNVRWLCKKHHSEVHYVCMG